MAGHHHRNTEKSKSKTNKPYKKPKKNKKGHDGDIARKSSTIKESHRKIDNDYRNDTKSKHGFRHSSQDGDAYVPQSTASRNPYSSLGKNGDAHLPQSAASRNPYSSLDKDGDAHLPQSAASRNPYSSLDKDGDAHLPQSTASRNFYSSFGKDGDAHVPRPTRTNSYTAATVSDPYIPKKIHQLPSRHRLQPSHEAGSHIAYRYPLGYAPGPHTYTLRSRLTHRHDPYYGIRDNSNDILIPNGRRGPVKFGIGKFIYDIF
ncbi:hypothetical protein B0O99DRAFT_183513 [Bisporella sp. PMI_857]|nr:hypothetical protein B0O99DRAFT_183513 [Bisporella sp. PMI_857]